MTKIQRIKRSFLFLIVLGILVSSYLVSSNIELYAATITGPYTNVIVFVDFSDSDGNFMSTSEEAKEVMSIYNDGKRSFSKYLNKISNGQLVVNNIFPQLNDNKIETYTLSHNRAYYTSEYSFLKDVHNKLVADGCSYSIDNLTIIVEGDNNGMGDLFYPHKAEGIENFTTYNLVDESSFFDSLQKTGVVIHEFMHSLGFPDLYRYNGAGDPVYVWDIMSSVSCFLQYPLAYQRYSVGGWINIPTITKQTAGKSSTQTLYTIDTNPNKQAVIIKTPASDTEFFVVEYRKKGQSIDSSIDYKLPGSGIIVYRVNTSVDNGNASGEDYIYIFRPGETGDNTSAGEPLRAYLTASATTGALALPWGRSIGNADQNATISQGALTYSDGSNSGIVISNVGTANENTITFSLTFNEYESINWNTAISHATESYDNATITCDGSNNIYTAYTDSNNRGYLTKYSNGMETVIGKFADSAYNINVKYHNGKIYILYADNNYNCMMTTYNGTFFGNKVKIANGYCNYMSMDASQAGVYIIYTDNSSHVHFGRYTIENGFSEVPIPGADGELYNVSINVINNKLAIAYSDIYENTTIKLYSNNTFINVPFTHKARNVSLALTNNKIYITAKSNSSTMVKLYIYDMASATLGQAITINDNSLLHKAIIYEDRFFIALGITSTIVYEYTGSGFKQIGTKVSTMTPNSIDLIGAGNKLYVHNVSETKSEVRVTSATIINKVVNNGNTQTGQVGDTITETKGNIGDNSNNETNIIVDGKENKTQKDNETNDNQANGKDNSDDSTTADTQNQTAENDSDIDDTKESGNESKNSIEKENKEKNVVNSPDENKKSYSWLYILITAIIIIVTILFLYKKKLRNAKNGNENQK